VNWAMVKAEGWYDTKDKNGKFISKWRTMAELMFQYRAASFFGRLYAPDILNGMHSVEETVDIVSKIDPNARLEELQELFVENGESLSDEDKEGIERVITNKEVNMYTKAITHLKTL